MASDPIPTTEALRVERQVNDIARLMNATFTLDPEKLARIRKEANRD